MSSIVSRLRPVLLSTLLLGAGTSLCYADGIAATSTYTSAQVSPGVYNYSLTLNNTGTTTIGTFWFAWVPGAGFLSATPSAVGSPADWTEIQTNAGAGIQWKTADPIAAGEVLSGFTFTSTETPAQLLLNYTGTGAGAGDPVTTSFVYAGAPLVGPGASFVAMPSAVAATPEPGSLLLMLTGCGLGGFSLRHRRRAALAG